MAGLTPVKPDNVTTYNHPRPTNEKVPYAERDAPSPPSADQFNGHDKEILKSGDNTLIKYMGYNGNSLTWAVTFFATVGFSLFGYDQGLMSGIIASRQFNSEFPATKQISPTDVLHGTIQGTVTSVYEVGAFFGAMSAFFIGERLGRRKMMLLGATIMIIGTIIQITAIGAPSRKASHGFAQFITGRIITGVGNGMNTATIPSWVAECSKAHNRGFLVCIEASTVAVGTAIAYWLDFGLSFVDSSVSWRFPTAFQIMFAIILIVGVIYLPESPHWLLAHSEENPAYEQEALRICAALNGVGIADPATVAQKNLIMDGINARRRANVQSSMELLARGKKQHLRRALVGASTQIFQQLGGCNAVIYYSTILFQNQIGLDIQLSLILGGVLSTVYALAALTSFLLVERCGRRPMFLWGTAGQAIGLLITFGCLLPGTKGPAKGAAFGLFFFICSFAPTILPLPWLYPAELNSLSVRTQANAVSTMCNWLFNFLVVQVLPTMTASIGAYTFLFFAVMNIIFFPIMWLFYPETAGRSLPEIDVLFAHAHLSKRRPTLVADEMPPLNDHQVDVLQERYNIHGEATAEAIAADEKMDLSIPPAEATTERTDEDRYMGSGQSTRVPSVHNA